MIGKLMGLQKEHGLGNVSMRFYCILGKPVPLPPALCPCRAPCD